MKKRPPEPAKSNEAPAYMGQYASLMTILLAFFIIMLTLGQDRVAQYKVGVGKIRNLSGFAGGTGILDFWRSVRNPPAPKVLDTEEEEDAMLIGYEYGARDSFSLNQSDIHEIKFEDPRAKLRIHSAIRFVPSSVRIHRDTQFALDQAATLLYSLQQHHITVEARVDTGNPEADRMLALQRAAWLTRHFVEHANIPADRMRAIGLAQTLEGETDAPPPEVTFILKKTRATNERPRQTR